MAQSLRSVPVLLDDGQRVQNLRVPQLLSALTDLGVPTDTLPKLRAEKVILLTTTLSKSRAAVGQFGALEDGRTINDLSVDDVRAELSADRAPDTPPVVTGGGLGPDFGQKKV